MVEVLTERLGVENVSELGSLCHWRTLSSVLGMIDGGLRSELGKMAGRNWPGLLLAFGEPQGSLFRVVEE